MKLALIKANVLNLNDRFYTLKSLETIIETFNQKPPVYFQLTSNSFEFEYKEKLNDFIVEKLYIEDDVLFGDVTFLDTKEGQTYKKLVEDKSVVIRTNCAGNVLDTKEVEVDYLIGFGLVLKSTDAFQEIL